MGVDVDIWVKEEDLKRMIKNEFLWHFLPLVKLGFMRWYRFEWMFGLDDANFYYDREVTSKDLLKHLASNPNVGKNTEEDEETPKLDRELWAEILSEYDIVFCPDDHDFDKEGYIDLMKYYRNIEHEVDRNFEKYANDAYASKGD